MARHVIHARAPRGEVAAPAALQGPHEVAAYLQDAARTPGGHTPRVLLPASEGEVAWSVSQAPALLPIGAQSSLTGGATPFGEWVLATNRLTQIGAVRGDRVTAGAGVALQTLSAALAQQGLEYPPVPTFTGALVGGVAATNAAGAATFKYGSTREWVAGLTVVLANGDVVELERGHTRAHPDGFFEIVLTGAERRRVPVPAYTMPAVAKRSAGYHAEPEMDIVDLFVGSEGTLGVIVEVCLRVQALRPRLAAWLSCGAERQALELVDVLRAVSLETRRSADPRGLDVVAIESLDRRCLELLREDGKDRECGVPIDAAADAALLFEIEMPAGGGPEQALERLALLLDARGLAERLILALPGETRRRKQLEALRESVPLAVNHRVAEAQRTRDPLVRKVAADMVVPSQRLAEAMELYRRGFAARGLDHALWGHVSDGNIHANAIPRTREDVRQGDAAILEFGREVIRMGGCPMSEHGVGRNAVKQELLRLLYGDAGIDAMRLVKRSLDPEQKLAPGVLFPALPAAPPARWPASPE